MIQAQSITVLRAEREIIHGFNLIVEAEKIIGIMGPNGSGKSTLLSALAGDLPLALGSIKLDGSPINSFSIRELAKIRSVSSQHQRFPLAFRVSELLEMSHRYCGDERSAREAIVALDIKPLLTRRVTSLSGGEQQRVGIAMALAQNTPYLFLDEPFAAQDLESSARIVEHLKALASGGKAIVIVAHMSTSELAWCDELVDVKTL